MQCHNLDNLQTKKTLFCCKNKVIQIIERQMKILFLSQEQSLPIRYLYKVTYLLAFSLNKEKKENFLEKKFFIAKTNKDAMGNPKRRHVVFVLFQNEETRKIFQSVTTSCTRKFREHMLFIIQFTRAFQSSNKLTRVKYNLIKA